MRLFVFLWSLKLEPRKGYPEDAVAELAGTASVGFASGVEAGSGLEAAAPEKPRGRGAEGPMAGSPFGSPHPLHGTSPEALTLSMEPDWGQLDTCGSQQLACALAC